MYLTSDAHHIISLSNNGLDHPSNILCVCPNCHRRFHSGEYKIIFEELKPKCKNMITNSIFDINIDKHHHLIKKT
jgi:hypothetical protein